MRMRKTHVIVVYISIRTLHEANDLSLTASLTKEPTPTQDKVKPAEENVKRLRKEGAPKEIVSSAL